MPRLKTRRAVVMRWVRLGERPVLTTLLHRRQLIALVKYTGNTGASPYQVASSATYPPADPSPPGLVISIGSNAAVNSASGNIFFSRQSSRMVLPVFTLSLAISAARS